MNHRRFDRYSGTRKKHERWVRTVCQECSLRCGLIAYLKNGGIVDIHGDDDHPVSRGRLCARGLAFVQGIVSPERITCPAFRKSLQEPFTAMEDWEKALDWYAERLRKIKDQHGAESIFIGCDPEADLDFAIGATRFAVLLGTPHVYHPFDFPQIPSQFPWPPYPASPCYEWGHSKCLFLIEADLAATHPVAFGWVLEAQQHGAKIIAADTRFTRTLSKADLPLRIRPNSGNVLGLALMKIVLENPGPHDDIAQARFNNPEKWRASFDQLSWEDMKKALGLTPESLKELQDLLRGNLPTTIVTGRNLAAFEGYGVWPTLVTAKGWGGTKGSGWYPLESTTPPLNPCRGIADRSTEKVPQGKETQAPGILKELRERVKKGEVRARAILCAGDCLGDFLSFFQGLEKRPDLMATFGSFPNITQELSHLVFPAAIWAEKSGLCFSNDRAIHWAEKILEPRPGCRSGLDFWLGLAKRFGWAEAFPWIKEDGSADQRSFYQWVVEGSPVLKGFQLDRLKDQNQAPDPGFWSLRVTMEGDGKIEPTPAPKTVGSPAPALDREHFPLYFQKIPFVSRSGTIGRYWPWTQNLEEEDAVQINPETAMALHIENGDAILISSPVGTMEGRAWISRLVPPGMVASPKNSEEDWVLVHKKDQTGDEALTLLKEFLP